MDEDELNILLGIVPPPPPPAQPDLKKPKKTKRVIAAPAIQPISGDLEHGKAISPNPDPSSAPNDGPSSSALRQSGGHRSSQDSDQPVKETHIGRAAHTANGDTTHVFSNDQSLQAPAETTPVVKDEDGVKERDYAEPTSTSPPAVPDAAQVMLDTLIASLAGLGKPTPPATNAHDLLDRIQQQIQIKMEEEPIKTALPPGSVTTAESIRPDIKPPRDFHVVRVHSRIPGSRRRRIGYRVVRDVGDAVEGYSADIDDTGIDTDTVIEQIENAPPEPPTPFQRNLQSTFSPGILAQVESMAQTDNTMGNHLPMQFRDIFTAMSDLPTMVEIANHLRRQLDLPPLSMRTDRVALRRAVAQMRLNLYTDLACALVVPLAPEPLPVTDDEEDKEKVERISLTPTSLTMLAKQMPNLFPREKYAIKRFLADPDAPYGERKGKVVWTQGIGKITGGDIMGPGFRGKVSNDGLVNVFVDHSNVLHGLTHHVYNQDSRSLPPRHLRTLSLPVLSLLLRRGRHTPHGSLHLVASSPLHQNLDPLVRLGWEVSIMKRVEVYEDDQVTSSAPSSLTHPRASLQGGGLRRYREQGVDEMLHLKLLQALNAKPVPAPEGSTIVLATGDARGGQFNRDGFVGAVKEAIKRGWAVELWSFSDGLSHTWRDLKRKEKLGGKFTIRMFDEWAGMMVEAGSEHEASRA